jgi:hypothetical protein
MDEHKLGALIELHNDTLTALKQLWVLKFGTDYPNVTSENKAKG